MVLSPSHDAPGMLALIRQVYEAALDAPRWREFLALFCAEFRSEAGAIWAYDFSERTVGFAGAPPVEVYHGFDTAYVDSFIRHYCRCNVWVQDERKHWEGMASSSSRGFSDAQLPRTEWYGDWLQPQDLFYSCAAVVEKRAQRSFNVTALRSRGRGEYSDEELQRLGVLMPHLQTAVALHRRLSRTQALAHASLAVLEGLPMGVILLDERADVLHANGRARALTRADGLLQLGGNDRLFAARHEDDLKLQKAMAQVVRTGNGLPMAAGAALRLRGLDGRQLQVLVTPLPRWASPFESCAAGAVFVSDPGHALQSFEAVLRGCYGMTAAEARLAQALVNGLSLAEHASELGLSIHTVRSQFKSAALRVGVGRQADFVRAILTGPALLRWSEAAMGATSS